MRAREPMPDILQANVIRSITYLGLILSLPAPIEPLLFVPFGAFFAIHAIHFFYLYGFKRPCGHMRITQGGRLGFSTVFIHRTCPMCGDRIGPELRGGRKV